MASNASFNELETMFNCAICMDYFKDPQVLECGHSFCRECVDQLSLCPTDRRKFDKNQLRPNYELTTAVEAFAKLSLKKSLDDQNEASSSSSKNPDPITSTSSSMISDIFLMKQRKEFCDVLVFHQDTPTVRIQAHRVVLARSNFFRTRFTGGKKEGDSFLVEIEGPSVDPATLDHIIEFMYTNCLKPNSANCLDLFLLAKLFELEEAQDLCLQFIKEDLHVDNSIEALLSAHSRGVNEFVDLATGFVLDNFGDVCKKEEAAFVKLTAEQIKALLASDDLNAPEQLVLQMAVNWLNYQPETRHADAVEILCYVRFNLLPQEQLANLTSDSELFRQFPVCKDLVHDALCLAFKGTPPSNLRIFQKGHSDGNANLRASSSTNASPLLYLIGGWDGTKYMNSVQCFNFEKNLWTCSTDPDYFSRGNSAVHFSLPPPPSPEGLVISCGQAVVINNCVYYVVVGTCGIVGGNTQYRTETHIFDMAERKWSKGPTMNQARFWASLVQMNGCIFSIGGSVRGRGSLLSLSERLKITPGEIWEQIAPMNTERTDLCAVCMENRIYAIGGCQDRNKSVECYDEKSGKWTFVAPMKEPTRSFHSASVLDNRIYVAGGSLRGETRATTEYYDPSADEWTLLSAHLSIGRRHAQMVSHKGFLYIIGGTDEKYKTLSSVERYDPSQNKWTLLTSQVKTSIYNAAAILF